MKEVIAIEEYEKAYEIVERYKLQCKPKTKNVTVIYNAEITVDIELLDNGETVKEIKEDLKTGYNHYNKLLDEPSIDYKNIKRMLINGIDV